MIVPVDSRYAELSKLGGELVGVVTGDPAVLQIQKYGDIVIRNYMSITDLLNAVANGEIEAALLNRVPASAYIADLYAGKLKIASDPMTDAGLHLVAPKGKNERLIALFNKSLDHLKKKKKVGDLRKKWDLD